MDYVNFLRMAAWFVKIKDKRVPPHIFPLFCSFFPATLIPIPFPFPRCFLFSGSFLQIYFLSLPSFHTSPLFLPPLPYSFLLSLSLSFCLCICVSLSDSPLFLPPSVWLSLSSTILHCRFLFLLPSSRLSSEQGASRGHTAG